MYSGPTKRAIEQAQALMEQHGQQAVFMACGLDLQASTRLYQAIIQHHRYIEYIFASLGEDPKALEVYEKQVFSHYFEYADDLPRLLSEESTFISLLSSALLHAEKACGVMPFEELGTQYVQSCAQRYFQEEPEHGPEDEGLDMDERDLPEEPQEHVAHDTQDSVVAFRPPISLGARLLLYPSSVGLRMRRP